MRKRVEFRLSMPGRGNAVSSSWGADRNYTRVLSVSAETATKLITEQPYFHRWDDGWMADIHVRVMKTGERPAKSSGFAGYDWMIDNIIRYGSPYTTGTTEGQTPAGHKR